jgi:hypothetical protein
VGVAVDGLADPGGERLTGRTELAAEDDRGRVEAVHQVRDDADPTSGNLDGSGYSFSKQALASVGVQPGGPVTSGSTTFTCPTYPPVSRTR